MITLVGGVVLVSRTDRSPSASPLSVVPETPSVATDVSTPTSSQKIVEPKKQEVDEEFIPNEWNYDAIGPEGGKVLLIDGSGVTIRAGALTADQPIKVSLLPEELKSAPVSVDRGANAPTLRVYGGIELAPDGLAFSPKAPPSTVEVSIDTKLDYGYQMYPVKYDEGNKVWVLLKLSDGSSGAISKGDSAFFPIDSISRFVGVAR